MNIIILTQDENYTTPFLLKKLFSGLKKEDKISAVFLLDSMPIGIKKKSSSSIGNLISVFGFKHIFSYYFRDIRLKLIKQRTVRSVLNAFNIPFFTFKESINSKNSLKQLRDFSPDLIISIGTYQIFKKDLISIPRIGILNYHEALLPDYKGLLPAFWALKNNEEECGISLFLVDEGIDTGKIVVQKRMKIPAAITHLKLVSKLKKLGAKGILEALEIFKKGEPFNFVELKEEGSYFTFPNRKDILEFEASGKKLY
ncbi:MAG: formyltransferase family protein [Bacteroidales bacterium]